MSSKRHTLIALLAAAAMMLQGIAAAEEVREAARKLIASHGEAVITIEIVTLQKFSWGGNQQESEEKTEALGTVVGEDGLVVTALSSVDQAQLYRRMQGGNEDAGDYTSTVKGIKFILGDNTEVPATVVLRDPDIDLAFLRPDKPLEQKMVAFDLSDTVKPGLVEPIFTIARMGRIARRTPLGMTGEIQGIVTRPRTFYIPSAEIVSGGTGVPVFNSDGKLLGVVLLHLFPGGRTAASRSDDMIIPVIVPAEEIANTAKQVPDKPIPAPETEAAPE